MSVSIRLLPKYLVKKLHKYICGVLLTEFSEYTIEARLFLTKNVYTLQNIRSLQKYKLCYICLQNNKIIGFILFFPSFGGVSTCRFIYVSTAYRRQGIGTKLVKKWTDFAINNYCHKLEVSALSSSQQFYRALGFFIEGLKEKTYFNTKQILFGKYLK